eukprot:TRINITY_DN1866_c0_g1_i5.p1 TRINITY_DN1866_c0_g1~~TRINITY_DN1866_c0_g1_i5.p1  ORF type:complete len:392 (-),score=26.25 TRINITY_DN1866_c0_g1_i5:363-1538(-)
MSAYRNNAAFVLLALFALYGAQPARGQSSGLSLSCPPGYLVQATRNYPSYYCITDPCYVNPCGPGNGCGVFQNVFGAVSNCTLCNAPYKRGTVVNGFPYLAPTGVCYLPGQDACNPNPCQNGGTCSYKQDGTGQVATDEQGTKFAFQCGCGDTGRSGTVCSEPIQPLLPVTATLNGVTGPLASAFNGVCSGGPNNDPVVGCLYADGSHYTCCTGSPPGCGPVGPDGVPLCPLGGYTPTPNDFPVQSAPTPQPAPSGDQGVCGSGAAYFFPTRCYFNSDPQGRYVCCDGQGCDGFNADNLTPHCKNNGYVPPNNGLAGPTPPSTPPSGPPSGSQGVCGTGGATDFPVRCWFNSDPQGRYVCCDNDGCNGFNPPDNSFPRCKTNGYVPPGFGV